MNFKLLRLSLCLLSLSAPLVARAIAQSGAISSAAEARAKFANDYNSGHYKDVIADGELLRKFNVLDMQSQLIIVQAYYKAGDFVACARYAKTLGDNETAQQLQARCAYEMAKIRTQP